jgi:hypothetical protein
LTEDIPGRFGRRLQRLKKAGLTMPSTQQFKEELHLKVTGLTDSKPHCPAA